MTTKTKNALGGLAFLAGVIVVSLSFWGVLAYTVSRAARLAWGTCG